MPQFDGSGLWSPGSHVLPANELDVDEGDDHGAWVVGGFVGFFVGFVAYVGFLIKKYTKIN